jgi:RNase H-fold protein (predicted Holliday junction resolvase)
MEIIKVDEDYTSVEANATTWNFQKKPGEEDTIAAMKILERFEG